MKSKTANKYLAEHVKQAEIAPIVKPASSVPVSKFKPIWNDRIATIRAALPAQMPTTIQLTPFATITNPETFISTHLEIVEFNNGNSRFLPYLERLEAVVKLLAK